MGGLLKEAARLFTVLMIAPAAGNNPGNSVAAIGDSGNLGGFWTREA
jgi:hypothetical protein